MYVYFLFYTHLDLEVSHPPWRLGGGLAGILWSGEVQKSVSGSGLRV